MSLSDFLKDKKSFKGYKKEIDPDVIGLDFDIMRQEHEQGVQIADPCDIMEMGKHFAWMRGHQNCWTGFPNDGKTQFTIYMMTVKALRSNWKFCIWSPEMKHANYVDGKVKVHYNVLAYDIMAILSGKTPYKHIHEKYGCELMTIDEKEHHYNWIKDHFVFLDPQQKKIDDIYKVLKRVYENEGYDGILIDPFKNIEPEPNKRDDQHLHDVFARFKDFSIETNTVMNWIAHPKSNVNRVVKGDLVPCNQYMLAGGAAWDNSMDGIYSIQRPNALNDISSPDVTFHNLKQRMQELVAERGSVENISFDIKKRRYYFYDNDPLDRGGKIERKIEKFPEVKSQELNFESEVNELYKNKDAPF